MAAITACVAYVPSQSIFSQPSQCLDWQSSAFEPTPDLFQSFTGDASAAAPPTNEWLYELGLNESNSSGEEGGALDTGIGVDGGLGLGIEWPLLNLDTSHETAILGGEVPPANLEDFLVSNESNFLFNSLADPTMPSATTIQTSQPNHFSMSPSAVTFDQPQQSTSVKRRSPPVDHVTALKRQRNNVAARKYRQKRIDRISELESELEDIKQERDDLRLRLARQEAETAALRSMLQMKSGGSQKS
ncbi:hypothetical protein F5Y19DRAFT_473900 [Xylariaceae sp. FL1651]|nr:hypothetical protein F5Y19DRAFT_473900 [Xylariaceae sp. FL1651]